MESGEDGLLPGVGDGALLGSNHDDIPSYVTPLRATLITGHNVTVATSSGETLTT